LRCGAWPGDLDSTARAPGHVDVALAETGAAGERLVVELPMRRSISNRNGRG
jgi:hypothetical protein